VIPPTARLLAGLCATLVWFSPVMAGEITVKGLTFSDELGGLRLLAAWGSGSLEDPVTVVEEIVDLSGAVLLVRGVGPSTGNPIPTNHPAGFALRKIVTNGTHQAWTFFDVELQKILGTPSDIYDGLSFGQDAQAGRPFTSNRFAQSVSQDEPRDSITFFDGVVEPGETVSLTFIVTATGYVPELLILQRPNRPLARLSHTRDALRRVNEPTEKESGAGHVAHRPSRSTHAVGSFTRPLRALRALSSNMRRPIHGPHLAMRADRAPGRVVSVRNAGEPPFPPGPAAVETGKVACIHKV
jgi:hypothetical protein